MVIHCEKQGDLGYMLLPTCLLLRYDYEIDYGTWFVVVDVGFVVKVVNFWDVLHCRDTMPNF